MAKRWVYTSLRKKSTAKARKVHEEAVRLGMEVIRRRHK